MTESQIETRILNFLKKAGVYCWRDRQDRRGKPNFGRGYIKNGTPDIIGILSDGTFLGIEVKKPGGKVRKEQEEFLITALSKGAVSMIVDNEDDVIEFFAKRGKF